MAYSLLAFRIDGKLSYFARLKSWPSDSHCRTPAPGDAAATQLPYSVKNQKSRGRWLSTQLAEARVTSSHLVSDCNVLCGQSGKSKLACLCADNHGVDLQPHQSMHVPVVMPWRKLESSKRRTSDEDGKQRSSTLEQSRHDETEAVNSDRYWLTCTALPVPS